MIVGDPYKFAIIVEYMPAWNIGDIWHNGVMLLSINGELFLLINILYVITFPFLLRYLHFIVESFSFIAGKI
ncbi:Imm42 family immunity protein [Riemerella columbipharyngis]|uniref:Immunity protein 42 n=1 Tax=Riemerella columbipharyngis TaxID=1071918 RepID=A0A1G7CMR4_9FLAO|nr:Immunity protein 42 [Riemerella columbipharyngis]